MIRADVGTSVTTVGSKKYPTLPMRLPPVRSRAPFGRRIGDEVLHRLDTSRVRQRAHGRRRIEPIADAHGAHRGHELFYEGLVGPLLNENTRRRGANLSGVAVFVLDQQPDRSVDIRVGEDECRRVASKLHGHPLHVSSGKRGELLAHDRRARKRDFADDRMRDEVVGNLRGDPKNEVDDAGRQTCVGEGAHELGA
jgi:hypothetical protein